MNLLAYFEILDFVRTCSFSSSNSPCSFEEVFRPIPLGLLREVESSHRSEENPQVHLLSLSPYFFTSSIVVVVSLGLNLSRRDLYFSNHLRVQDCFSYTKIRINDITKFSIKLRECLIIFHLHAFKFHC